MTNEEASIIIGNIPINGDECYSIPEYQQAKARAIEALEQQEIIIHCKDCKYRNYWGECNKWAKELDAHKTFLLDENMFCGFAEIKDGD